MVAAEQMTISGTTLPEGFHRRWLELEAEHHVHRGTALTRRLDYEAVVVTRTGLGWTVVIRVWGREWAVTGARTPEVAAERLHWTLVGSGR